MVFSIAIQFIIFLLLIYFVFKPSRSSYFPPGPFIWFPLLGHLPLLGTEPYKRLTQWKRTYGPIVGLWFGNHRVVAISEPELIKKALHSPSLAGRPALGLLRDWGLGLATSEGQHHSDQREFTLKQMKDYGFGNSRTQSKIRNEILSTVLSLKQYVGKPLSSEGIFKIPAAKIVWEFLLDEPANEEIDHQLQTILNRIANMFKENTATFGIVMFLPWIGKLFPRLSGLKRYQACNKQIEKFITDRVDTHKKTRQDNPRDFVDAHMEKVSKTQNPESCFHPSHNAIVHLMRDLIVGGSHAVDTLMTWLLAYMVTWPDVQQKLQNEIDVVVGHERNASLSDRLKMPYTLALIYELLRFSIIFPICPARRATEDVIFSGFYFPKGTIVLSNFYAVHFDKDIWGDPENFRPERFLDSSKRNIQRTENLLAFSVGKRACPGEGVGMDQLFLFTVHFFQAFKVKAGAKLPSLNGHFGVTRTPNRFEVILTSR